MTLPCSRLGVPRCRYPFTLVDGDSCTVLHPQKGNFGVIIASCAMDNVNRYADFADLCQMHHWIVDPVVSVIRAEAYQQAIGEITLDYF